MVEKSNPLSITHSAFADMMLNGEPFHSSRLKVTRIDQIPMSKVIRWPFKSEEGLRQFGALEHLEWYGRLMILDSPIRKLPDHIVTRDKLSCTACPDLVSLPSSIDCQALLLNNCPKANIAEWCPDMTIRKRFEIAKDPGLPHIDGTISEAVEVRTSNTVDFIHFATNLKVMTETKIASLIGKQASDLAPWSQTLRILGMSDWTISKITYGAKIAGHRREMTVRLKNPAAA